VSQAGYRPDRTPHKNYNATLYDNISPNETDELWNRSFSPINFGWMQLEPKPILLQGGAWNLGSGYTVQVCGTSKL